MDCAEAFLGIRPDCIELEYTKKDGVLEPGRYLAVIEEYEPKIRYHIQVKVICRADDLDDGYERYQSGGPYEMVLVYLSKQELARNWKEVGNGSQDTDLPQLRG